MQIHRFTGTPDTVPVNAYLVETADAVVIVDATLTVSGGRGLRRRLDELDKPLAGVLVTHAHPTTTAAWSSCGAATTPPSWPRPA